jgi:hypothetical protein
MSFFSAAAQGKADGVGVVLEVVDTSPGDETGEAVQVAELLYGWHRAIVTAFQGQGKPDSPAIFQVFREFGRKIHPLDFKKSHSNSATCTASPVSSPGLVSRTSRTIPKPSG